MFCLQFHIQSTDMVVTWLWHGCDLVVTTMLTTLLQLCYSLVDRVVAILNKLGISTWEQQCKGKWTVNSVSIHWMKFNPVNGGMFHNSPLLCYLSMHSYIRTKQRKRLAVTVCRVAESFFSAFILSVEHLKASMVQHEPPPPPALVADKTLWSIKIPMEE